MHGKVVQQHVAATRQQPPQSDGQLVHRGPSPYHDSYATITEMSHPSCPSCIAKAAESPAHGRVTPGPLYVLQCGHFHCRSCLSEHHQSHDPVVLSRSIMCPSCWYEGWRTACFRFRDPHNKSYLKPDWLVQAAQADYLNQIGHNYAATNCFVLENKEGRAILSAFERLVPAYDGQSHGITSTLILLTLDTHLASDGHSRVTTPELLETELREIVLSDLVYVCAVLQPGAQYHMLAGYFNTGRVEDDWRRQVAIVVALRQIYPDLEALLSRWEKVIRLCVSVFAKRWWERFE